MPREDKQLSEEDLLRGTTLYRDMNNYIEYCGPAMVLKCFLIIITDMNLCFDSTQGLSRVIKKLRDNFIKFELDLLKRVTGP